MLIQITIIVHLCLGWDFAILLSLGRRGALHPGGEGFFRVAGAEGRGAERRNWVQLRSVSRNHWASVRTSVPFVRWIVQRSTGARITDHAKPTKHQAMLDAPKVAPSQLLEA